MLFALLSAGTASASYGFATQWGEGGSGEGQFSYPYGVATDAAGNVYVADSGNHRIQKFDNSGTFILAWGSFGSGDNQIGDPEDVATDASGDVFVVDTLNHRIQKFDSSGNFITKWGRNGGGEGRFTFPYGIASGNSGNVYVADTGNNRIQEFDTDGVFITQWGTYGFGEGQFRAPRGIAVDAAGNVYVADEVNDRIQKFVPVPEIGKVVVSGPSSATKGKQATWKVRVTNIGDGTARGVELKVNGRGMKASLPIGNIPEEKSRTVKVKLKPKKTGKIKTTFKVKSKNAGTMTVEKSIVVKPQQ